ncbi:RagB/SusD family nutrient uptake outer membrane protein [Pontibacter akesuensis]|uniref:SusD family protein n=1 Tax=Pontibacter akesuensis TaxID=388950 RepID=A0A1I7JKF8_9BACT|nr:RagB/SusD family nutrient uptake outer membrane protein [Pontibacter akesuensis]GHA69330.1 membrane protein [Pontibacter akesuensis]SFU85674.1 SusD family protein [Pontibacter akesuensis]
MKNRFLYIGALALTFMSTGCEEEFLDKQPTEQLSPEQIAIAAETDPSLLNAFTAGLYSTMYNTGTGGTTGHDDFGQKGYDIYSDMLASDMVLSAINYGWYSTVARYQATTNNTLDDAYQPWRYYYRIIFGANTLIGILGGNDAVLDTPEEEYIMGQAKAMRAYGYFYLSQFYAQGYGTGSEKILPIYVDTEAPAQPLSTSEEVYSLMVSDLEEAITLLEGFDRSAKNEVNQEVAKGLLSYVLAARGTQSDLQRVVELTNDIITDGGYSLMTKNQLAAQFDADGNILNRDAAGFNDVSNQSWIWGVDLTLDIGLDLVSWWGQVDLFTYSYAWAGDPKAIDASLYAAIPADDIRKKQFVPTTNSRNLMPLNKFYAPDRRIGGQRNVVTDYVYMRLEEIYLLNAEAKARLGMDAEAREMLKMLVSTRVADASYIDALSGQALLNEIFLQTRIELWGEGKSYLAMKRLKQSITRGSNHLFFPGETFSWNDDELTFPIPQAEILNNPALNQ